VRNYVLQSTWAIPVVNYSNFFCPEYAVTTTARFWGSEIVYLDATNNYWSTTDPGEIDNLIYDRNDFNANDPFITAQAIYTYIPFLNRPYAGAGIQLNGD